MDSNEKKWLTISGVILLALSILGIVVWILWSKRKLEALKVQAAIAEEKIRSSQEATRIESNQQILKEAEKVQTETQLKLDKINTDISELKKEHTNKLEQVKKALTWEELDSI